MGDRAARHLSEEVASLSDKLENVIFPMYCKEPYGYARVRRFAIAINGSNSKSQRIMFGYVKNAYATVETV